MISDVLRACVFFRYCLNSLIGIFGLLLVIHSFLEDSFILAAEAFYLKPDATSYYRFGAVVDLIEVLLSSNDILNCW
jgi:hypothetical protein